MLGCWSCFLCFPSPCQFAAFSGRKSNVKLAVFLVSFYPLCIRKQRKLSRCKLTRELLFRYITWVDPALGDFHLVTICCKITYYCYKERGGRVHLKFPLRKHGNKQSLHQVKVANTKLPVQYALIFFLPLLTVLYAFTSEYIFAAVFLAFSLHNPRLSSPPPPNSSDKNVFYYR